MVREAQYRGFPTAMDRHHIARLVSAYARAAERCREGGLDGIEVPTGGHIIGQFLSPTTNLRSDCYGGSLANRCRFGLEVLGVIRERVGDDFQLSVRMSGSCPT